MNYAAVARWLLVLSSGWGSFERVVVFCREIAWTAFGLMVFALLLHWVCIIALGIRDDYSY